MTSPRMRAAVMSLWVVLASGPLLGGLALLRTTQAQVPTGPAPAHVMGFAESVVWAHRIDGPLVPPHLAPLVSPRPADTANTSASAGAAAAADSADPRVPAGPAHVAAVGSRAAGPGRWGVTVLVQSAGGPLEGWQVTVSDAASGPVAELAPTLIAVPARPAAAAPATGVGVDEDDPRSIAIRGFVQAYYVTHQDLDRWVAPMSPLSGMSALPGPVDRVHVAAITASPLGDGRQVALVEVSLRRAEVPQVMHLPLLISHAGPRWEVSSILPALPLREAAGT